MNRSEFSVNHRQGIGMTSARTRQRLIEQLKNTGISDQSLLAVLEDIPRHLFVDEALASRAYENTALPIGQGQTISQPYIVALMTQTLFNQPRKRVLEIGTGCGYQTAVLASLAERVVSVERIVKLHRQARDRLYDLGYRNIVFRHGDGFAGLAEFAPFDAILAAAASADIPAQLIEQLDVGGRLIMPLVEAQTQQLMVLDKTAEGIEKQAITAVKFVPRQAGLG